MSNFEWVAVALVTVLSAARITRLVTWDDFPPTKWWRAWYLAKAGDAWGKLFTCLWCFGPWATLGVLLWGYFSDWDTAWWLFNSWLAGGYCASMVVVRDGEDD